jgi:hypothetical protein
MVDGKEIKLGGSTFILPPCPLSGLSKLGDRLKNIGTGMSEEATSSLSDGVFYSLRRNYPEITQGFVSDNIDLLNVHSVVDAFVEVNGFQNEAAATGGIKAT